jgi:hypothetical protein
LVPNHTVAECIAEAMHLLAEAAKAASEQERLRLLRKAAAWLEIAKHRAAPPGGRKAGRR